MQVVEKFISLNGEGKRAGELACFVRFKGCNLACAYCDTKWANEDDVPFSEETPRKIAEFVSKSETGSVTLTGGEPLLQDGILSLVKILSGEYNRLVEIETNGSVDISPYCGMTNVSVTMDYKLRSSGFEECMRLENFDCLTSDDSVKFVVSDMTELEHAMDIIKRYGLAERCSVFFSPAFGEITPREIADYITENRVKGVRLQLQLHKVIEVR